MASVKKPKKNQPTVTHHKDGSVTIKNPTSKHSKPVTVLLESDDVLRAQAGNFGNFLRDYAVVGLAVGFIVGQQAAAVIKQLSASFIDPLVMMWFGQDLSTRTATIHHGTKPIEMPWGAFVYTLVGFIIIILLLYVVIKVLKLDKFKKPDAK